MNDLKSLRGNTGSHDIVVGNPGKHVKSMFLKTLL